MGTEPENVANFESKPEAEESPEKPTFAEQTSHIYEELDNFCVTIKTANGVLETSM